MEKLKLYLFKIYQHHFWVLILVAIAILFYGWNVGTGEMKRSFDKNQGSIKRLFSDLSSKSKSRAGNNFPNENWVQKRQKLTVELKENGAKAWESVLGRQRSIQSWPEDLHELSKKEILEDDWGEETIADYKRIVPQEIARLRTILGVKESTNDPGVGWNQEDYDSLEAGVGDIREEKDCKVFQQVLWIYEALAVAIQQTNQGATDPYRLPVESIEATAASKGAAENINESAWKVAEEPPVKEKIPEAGRGKSRNIASKKKKRAPSSVSIQKPLKEEIDEPISVDGYDVIAFRLKVRMQIGFLQSLLRALANSPVPLVIEGLRFKQTPELTVVEQKKPKRGRTGSQLTRRRREPEEKTLAETTQESTEYGTLVEIWGFAYLVKIDDPPVEDEQSVQKFRKTLPTAG